MPKSVDVAAGGGEIAPAGSLGAIVILAVSGVIAVVIMVNRNRR